MAVVINEIVTEVAVAPAEPAAAATAAPTDQLELVIRRATERVLETLRREWDL